MISRKWHPLLIPTSCSFVEIPSPRMECAVAQSHLLLPFWAMRKSSQIHSKVYFVYTLCLELSTSLLACFLKIVTFAYRTGEGDNHLRGEEKQFFLIWSKRLILMYKWALDFSCVPPNVIAIHHTYQNVSYKTCLLNSSDLLIYLKILRWKA